MFGPPRASPMHYDHSKYPVSFQQFDFNEKSSTYEPTTFNPLTYQWTFNQNNPASIVKPIPDTTVNKTRLLSFGYCNQMRLNIPQAIIKLINLYNTKYDIFGIGPNYFGQLSVGYASYCVPHWTKLIQYENICTNYANIYSNCASITVISADHSIHFVGCNEYHEWVPKVRNTVNLQQIKFDEKAALISTGHSNQCHSFIYTINDKLYANGANSFNENNPTKMLISRFWKQNERLTDIKCNGCSSLFLTDTGTVYETNMISNKTLLIDFDIKAIDIAKDFCMFLKINGIMSMSSFEEEFPCGATIFNCKSICEYFENKQIKIKCISAGSNHAMVLTESNDCYTFGENALGQCGNDLNKMIKEPYKLIINDISMISCGGNHNLILTNTNEAYSFGVNYHKQCGQTSQLYITTPYHLDKTKEFKAKELAYIECVKALPNSSIIIINPNKTVKR